MSDRSIDTITSPLAHPEAQGKFLRIYTSAGSFDVRLEEGTWTVGRGSDAQVRIDDPSVSRAHARLHLGAHALVEDLASANGTRVGGRLLAPGKPVLVTAGTPIEFGHAMAVLRSDPHRAPTMLSTATGAGDPQAAAERMLDRLAQAEVPVLIEGETGVGKDHMAQRIHARSKRSAGPLVRVSCALVRGGKVDVADAFARAASGSLLLDEVADLDAEGQGLLLGAWTVAEQGAEANAARVLSMSSRDLPGQIDMGAFRSDLYYRLAHLTLVVPPLRTRAAEIFDLATALLAELSAARGGSASGDAGTAEVSRPPPLLSADALRVLQRYPWPGNVRELRMALERALVFSPARVLTASHFESLEMRPAERRSKGGASMGTQSLREAAEAAEHERILEALRVCHGNQTRAAKQLGISRGTLIARLERYHVPRPRKP